LCERYTTQCPIAIPSNDEAVHQRSRGKRHLTELIRAEKDKVQAMKDAVSVSAQSRGGAHKRQQAENEELLLAALGGAGVPSLLKEFLSRLPSQYSGPMLDADVVIRQLRTTVLPPKPSLEDRDDDAYGSGPMAKKVKTAGEDDEDDLEAESEILFFSRDDIFRRRQRERLLH
jgi:hypothetical protein